MPSHGRSWELVTADETNGNVLLDANAWAADGDRVMYLGLGPRTGAQAGDLVGMAVAARTPQGWHVTPVANAFNAHGTEFTFPALIATDAGLSSWLWASARQLLPGAPDNPEVGFYRQASDGTLTLLGAGGSRDDGFTVMGAADDLDHVTFQTRTVLAPVDAGRTDGMSLYEIAGSTLRPVDVDDHGALVSTCGAVAGSGDTNFAREKNPVSDDGQRIFFTAPAYASCGVQRVYVRENGVRTIDVSASSCARPDCNDPQEVAFLAASADGSKVFLRTKQQLTDDDVDESADIYRRDLPAGTLTRLSAGPPGSSANVDWAAVSDDGERVYFVASGALAPGAQEGASNFYVSDHGVLRFVAKGGGINRYAIWDTRDGGTFVFSTNDALLPSDLDTEFDVYSYDAEQRRLTHVSKGVGGRGNQAISADVNGGLLALQGSRRRFSSEDGRRVFFVTAEQLVPEDHNDKADVYEWADGDLGLVSSGTGTQPAIFAGATPDGRSVFFITTESLLNADHNQGIPDLYVARIGGGFPDPPVSSPVPCTEDACQRPPSDHGQRSAPDSASAPGEQPVAVRKPLRIRALTAQARRQLAVSGQTWLSVEVPAAGVLSLTVRARVWKPGARTGRTAVVASARTRVQRAGVTRLRIRLSRAARQSLTARRSLSLTFAARHTTLGAARSMSVKLVRPASRRTSGGGR